ncbi:hypothetical protein A0128_00875 [Leptospira tipperaryensis]|uniref:Uncharacterized protein n=1 Tax=Leptospira tipperaryensis TaxID=2564040 RepID=A0A1D7USK7_9LEPT|nr:hypothetical protein [Leptospira tipperaryensis]AOP32555.1 hypothetical protein A0128_00875 [Leptospira tipperaryensis]
MKTEACAECKQNISLSQTDLCKDCLRDKFKELIPMIDTIRTLHPTFSRFSSPKEPKGAA